MNTLKTTTVIFLLLGLTAHIVGCSHTGTFGRVVHGTRSKPLKEIVEEHLSAGTPDNVAMEFMAKEGFKCVRDKNCDDQYDVIQSDGSRKFLNGYPETMSLENVDCLRCSRNTHGVMFITEHETVYVVFDDDLPC